MAQQINSKLSSNPMETSMTNGHAVSIGTTHQQSNESVDLDNLFAFLSEVTPNHSKTSTIDDESGDKMAQDLDIELENVIQQEIEGLALDKPKTVAHQKTGVPSLPEPTMPPPPPPVVNGLIIPPPVSMKIHSSRRNGDEPIYEAVIPREELPTVPELPEGPPMHLHDSGHKLR